MKACHDSSYLLNNRTKAPMSLLLRQELRLWRNPRRGARQYQVAAIQNKFWNCIRVVGATAILMKTINSQRQEV